MANAPVFPLIAAAPAVTAVIGASPVRCYPGVIPQTTDGTPNLTLLPCLVYQLITGTPEVYLSEASSIGQQRVQIDAYATTFAAATALAELARTALEDGATNVCVSENGNYYEPETKAFRSSFDMEFWVRRP